MAFFFGGGGINLCVFLFYATPVRLKEYSVILITFFYSMNQKI